ncbi:hypothetical protein F442_15157 [Phytophthora nicotianae P10297]|uniref:PiggyBac transposable element-derived protein domain-containing protein n=1 Tax=Phytophthora nicotianae P10297 TaxID=1317064 RepID=W2YPV4_PHYNI|nr:hypothetical protein F442_15157 [Phytophthora nicotianae P10297]
MNPNGSAVLVGESAVMEYVIKSGLLDGDDGNEGNNEDEGKEDNDGDKSKDDNEGDDGNKGNEGDKVNKSDKGNERVDEIRASQIDTIAELSQNTLNDLFGSSSDSDVELSQAAASGMESDSQLDPLPATAPDQAHRARSNIKTDVNYIPENENMNAYESYSSGSSDDNVNEDNDDSDDLKRGYRDEQDDVVSEDDAVEMDQAFVDSLLFGDDASSPHTVQQRENALRATEWGPLAVGFETDAQAYPGLKIEDARPVSALRTVAHSHLLTLFYFVPKSLWISIGIGTNRYGL